jgi:hypothetical protein
LDPDRLAAALGQAIESERLLRLLTLGSGRIPASSL